MTQVSSTIMIHASADAIWRLISDFGAAGQHLAMVVTCTVKGEGVGARRTLTYGDGSTIVERMQTLDEAARQLSYVLLTDTPFGDCRTSMVARDLDPNQAELRWSVTFQPDGMPETEAVALLEGALAANCLALKRFMEAGGTAPGRP